MAKDFPKLKTIIDQYDRDKEATNLFTWFDVLHIELYGSYDEKNYNDLEDYIKKEFVTDKPKLQVGKNLLNGVKTLQNPLKEKQYKEKLEKAFKEKLEKLVETLSEGDTITEANRKKVLKQAKQHKLTNETVDEIIKKKNLIIITDNGGGGGIFPPEGTPIIEIINSTTNEKLQEIVLSDVKLSSKVTQTIIIKNGGGGYLNATVKPSVPWIQVSSDKIEQKDLPKSINVIINPSRDKTLKNSAIYEGKLVFSYTTPKGKTQTQDIPIEITTEGYEKLIKRKIIWVACIYLALFWGWSRYSTFPTPTLWGYVLGFISLSLLLAMAKVLFGKWPVNKPMVVLLPSIFFACMYYGIKTVNKPKDADLLIIPMNQIGYVKPAEGAYVRDFPISGTILGPIVYGDSLRVMGKDSTSHWYKVAVTYDGEIRHGYMSNELLTFDISEIRSRKKKETNGSKAIRATNKSRKHQADSTNNVDESTILKPNSI